MIIRIDELLKLTLAISILVLIYLKILIIFLTNFISIKYRKISIFKINNKIKKKINKMNMR